MMEEKQNTFENMIAGDLHTYLHAKGFVGTVLQSSPDIEDKWESIARSYIHDGAREFGSFPTAVLAWMMYIGMAVAQYWETEWEVYGKVDDLYVHIRDKRDYDHLDETVCEEILRLDGEEQKQLMALVAECAQRTYDNLLRQRLEPGTAEAFRGFIACLHQLYLHGVAVQLQRQGYRMEAI